MAETVAGSSRPPAPTTPEPQYYIKNGDDVRTLGADQIRLEITTKVLHPDSLICKVGDTQWRALSDASALGLELPPLDTPSGIVTKQSVRPAGANFAKDPFARPTFRERLSRVENKGTIAVWMISLAVSSTIVMQRNGTFRSIAESWGMKDGYVSFEKDLFGGPGAGTVPEAESRFNEFVKEGSVPFADVEARATGKPTGDKTSDDKTSDD